MRERVREWDVEDRDGEPQHNGGTTLVDEDGSSGGGLRQELSSPLDWFTTSWWFLRLAAARSRLIVMVVRMILGSRIEASAFAEVILSTWKLEIYLSIRISELPKFLRVM